MLDGLNRVDSLECKMIIIHREVWITVLVILIAVILIKGHDDDKRKPG